MKTKIRSVLGLAASFSLLCGLSVAHGDLLYQWNFNGSDGSNTGTGGGGTLTANAGAGATTGSFSQAGVSGSSWDHCLYTSNANDYWWGTDIGNAAGVSNLNLAGLNQFTITMWIKRSGGNNASLLNIGSTTSPSATSNPGISLGVNGNWDNGVRFGVNGYSAWTGDLWGAGYTNEWVFVAFAYDGNGGIWYNEAMNTLYGQHRNGAVITGGLNTPATVAANLPIHIGDWGTSAGVPALSATSTAFLGNDGPNATGFSGNMDDVRIYNNLLTVAQIEAIRQSAFAEPSPPVDLYWKGDVDDSWTSLNWTADIAGTVPGGALPADGSAGIAFATTGAAFLTNMLGGDQNVKSIVVTEGSGPVVVGGTHNLTLGSNGIWIELTALGLTINTSGGVLLDSNQVWKNKSPNPLIVDSNLSGPGMLTKSGTGPLRLGGDNLHSGGTVVEQGSLVLGHAHALGASSATLAMNGGTLDLNGFSVTLGGLSGATGAIIRNSSATPCTLMLDLSTSGAYSCAINDGPGTGAVSLVKLGAGNVTSNAGGSFTGSVSIENGQFIANYPNYGGAPTSSSLGNLQVAGRTITVTAPGSLSLTNNNIFGNQNANPALLPEVTVNGTTLSATNYNLLGPVTLNSAILSQSTTNTSEYQGYQFKGRIKVTGTSGASMISGSGGNHLSSNTVFEVEEVTLDAGPDLVVTTPLRDQSGDFASAPGGLTKTGPGTMSISGPITYTGNTTVSEGQLTLSASGLSDTGATEVAGTAVLALDFTGEDLVGSLVLDGVSQGGGTYGAIGSGADHESALLAGTGKLRVAVSDPFAEWIAGFPTLIGPAASRSADPDGDGLTNLQEFAFDSAPDSAASGGSFRSETATVGTDLAFILTLPVRDGAVFANGSPAIAVLADEHITYRIEGSNGLSVFDQGVSKVEPAHSAGLPVLDSGWSYRTFRLDGALDGGSPRGPQGFLRAKIVDDSP